MHILLDIRHRLSYPFAMDKPDSKTKLTAIRIDRADLDALAPIAEAEGRSVASCIRQAIKEWVKVRARKAARAAKPSRLMEHNADLDAVPADDPIPF